MRPLSNLNVDAHRMPVRNGTFPFNYDVAVPCDVFRGERPGHPLMLGHGFFGKGVQNADLETYFVFDDHEDREDRTLQVRRARVLERVHAARCEEREVRRVEHEFDADEHDDGIAPSERTATLPAPTDASQQTL